MQPATHASVLLLLIVALVCFGSWINAFKAVAGKWRFELFSLDFAVGSVVVALLATFTLGTMGSELGFGDRILVAGRTAQALAIIAGAVFNLGSMLLLAAVALLGISTAFPFAIGVALIVSSCFHFQPGNVVYLVSGMLVMFAALLFDVRAARLCEGALLTKSRPDPAGKPAVPASMPPLGVKPSGTSVTAAVGREKLPKPPLNVKSPTAVKGLMVGLIAGVCLGLFVPILQNCLPTDFGLGAYAGMLLFSIGVLGSTIVYDFYFLNITIEGAPLAFTSYFRGDLRWHVAGLVGGAVFMAGLLATALAVGSPASGAPTPFLRVFLPLLFVLLAWVFGVSLWKELAVPPASRIATLAGLLLFLCSLALFSFGFTH